MILIQQSDFGKLLKKHMENPAMYFGAFAGFFCYVVKESSKRIRTWGETAGYRIKKDIRFAANRFQARN